MEQKDIPEVSPVLEDALNCSGYATETEVSLLFSTVTLVVFSISSSGWPSSCQGNALTSIVRFADSGPMGHLTTNGCVWLSFVLVSFTHCTILCTWSKVVKTTNLTVRFRPFATVRLTVAFPQFQTVGSSGEESEAFGTPSPSLSSD
jgi:hypothetical protein